jgi:predicted lipoprotein with Yx(FWY)xxD motif
MEGQPMRRRCRIAIYFIVRGIVQRHRTFYGYNDHKEDEMKRRILTAAFAAAVCASGAVSTAFAAAPTASNGMAVDSNGMTLYTFDKDKAGSPSACTGGCAQAWPAAMADASDQPSGKWTTVAADGGKQWAYDGKRVYTFKKDTKAGDMNGDNFKDMWHVVKP